MSYSSMTFETNDDALLVHGRRCYSCTGQTSSHLNLLSYIIILLNTKHLRLVSPICYEMWNILVVFRVKLVSSFSHVIHIWKTFCPNQAQNGSNRDVFCEVRSLTLHPRMEVDVCAKFEDIPSGHFKDILSSKESDERTLRHHQNHNAFGLSL